MTDPTATPNPAEGPVDPTDEEFGGRRQAVALKQQVRTLRMQVTLLAIGCLVAFSLAAFAAFRTSASFREVRLKGPGGVRAKLNFEDGYPQLVFFDRDGIRRAQFDEAGLLLWGDDGTTMLRELGNISRLEFKRRYEGVETQTWLTNDGERQYFLLKNKTTDEQVRLTLEKGKGARLYLNDAENGAFELPTRDSKKR